jgi:hypothetical protein
MFREDIRILFYGFIVGTVLMVMPIPGFFFWRDVIEKVGALFRYTGFIFFTVCGIAILVEVIKAILRKI